MSKGTGGRRTGRKRPHPAKNFSPSRLDIKKGAFPSPTVSDGRPEAQGHRSAGGRIGEKAGAVTRKVGRRGVAAGWFLRSSHRRRTLSNGKCRKIGSDAFATRLWGLWPGMGWVTSARLPGNGGAPWVGRVSGWRGGKWRSIGQYGAEKFLLGKGGGRKAAADWQVSVADLQE